MEKSINNSLSAENARLRQKIIELEAIAEAAKQTENALINTQQELHNRNTILEAINAVTNKIYLSLDNETVTKEAIAAMIQYGKTPIISMFEYNEAEKCLIMIDHSESFKGMESIELTRKLYLDKSLTGYAVLEKKVILCPDIAKDQHILPATRKALLKEGRKSAVFIPLLFRDRVLGVMNLFFPQKYTFTEYELETLLSIGKTIGLAMANAKNIEKIKVEIEERLLAKEALHKTEQSLSKSQQNAKISNESLRIINAVADKIYLALDYDTLVMEAREAMKLYGKTSAVIMFEYNEAANSISLLKTSSDEEYVAETVRLTSKLLPGSLTAQTLHEKRIIICNDTFNDERINPEIKKWLIQYNLSCVISIPLLFRDKTLGVMNLFFKEKYNFTDYELETLLSIGKTIGLAMANARNIEKIKAEIEERLLAKEALQKTKQSLNESQQNVKISNESLRIINAVADRIYLALDYDTLIKEAVAAMTLYGKTLAAVMFEYNEDANTISLLSTSTTSDKDRTETVRLTSILLPESLTAHTIRGKRIIVCDDTANDNRISPEIKKWLIQYDLKCCISIPLLFRERTLGVINLFFREKYAFTDYELETLLSIGKTIGLAMANAKNIEQIKAEIEVRKIVEEKLRIKEKELENRAINLSENLSDTNTALKVLLQHKDDSRISLETNVLTNMRALVLPILDKLRKSKLFPIQFAMIDTIEKNLNDIVSPFNQNIKSKYNDLTNKEIEVANLIKQGKTTKEIAELLNVAKSSVDTHRFNLRKKLGLNNKEVNLRSYLETIS
jgi:GAF domain-containing protein/DNA-binding CsgD family transcriptional regulator